MERSLNSVCLFVGLRWIHLSDLLLRKVANMISSFLPHYFDGRAMAQDDMMSNQSSGQNMILRMPLKQRSREALL